MRDSGGAARCSHRSILAGGDKWTVFPIFAAYCESPPAMSSRRGSSAPLVATAVGVGAGFRTPTRTVVSVPSATNPPAPNADATTTNAPSTAATAPLVVTPPTLISHQQIKQLQAFLRQFAWIAVREMATMRVADQKKNLMIHYKGFINMFLNGTMPYTNNCFPPVPPSLASCERVTAFNILMQSTSRSTSVFTEDALFGKVKGNVRRILKFITEWCRACPSQTARNPGVFVPAEPPSGHDRDWVFDQIMRAEWRVKQCLRVYKLRVSKSALAENTPAAIRGALLSLNFARRSITLEEERNFLSQAVPDDPEHVYYQVVANTNAGFIADPSSSDDENPADTQGSSRPRSSSSIVTTQPAYHEIPFPSPHYDELEFAFKYFTQYAGHGHADISHFYSEEWLSRSSHASGAFGRRHQRALPAPSPSGAATVQTSVASSPPESSPSQAISSDTSEIDIRELTEQLRRSVQQQEVTNRFNSGQFHLQVRRERIDSLREALTVAKRLKKSQAEITKIDDMLYSLLLSEISENLPCASVDAQTRVVQLQPAALSARFNGQESQPIVSQTVSDQNIARPFQSASHQSHSHASPPLRRTCTRVSPLRTSQRDITVHLADFDELDVEKDGNCGFHVMVEIMQRHFPQHQEHNPNFIELRELICDLMSREANQIFIAKTDSFNIYIEDELITESGTVVQYCDRMKRDSVCCGLNEFATFVHMVGDDIIIMYHSTKVVGGSVEVFPLCRESCRDSAIVYHVLQKDAEDGRDGHFVLLLPRDNEHVETVD